MRRSIVGAWIVLIVSAPLGRAQGPDELRQTAQFVAGFQNRDGGFAAKPGGDSSLGATSSAIKILKYVGGSIPDPAGCVAFVKKCRDAESGGFAPTPGGKPDVPTTASGLMAFGELRIADNGAIDRAVDYLSEHARSFPEIRIAVAGLEAVRKTSPKFPDWVKQVNSDRNADGTWGEGPGRAFATGGAAVALLRMGQELDHKDAILDAMRDGQTSEGGWSGGDGPPDLSASYRVMRGFYMMKESPDLAKLRGFIARCRQSDGGYGTQPGKPADLGGTYYATIVSRWARELDGEPAFLETAGFVPLFNGKDLTGWEGDSKLWSAKDGMLVGESPGLDYNDFLATTRSYGDFVLKFSFRLVNGEGNSGLQFRSVRVPPHEMSGYQADIGEGFWGCLYDEARRNKILVPASERAKGAVHKSRWNHYTIRALGNHITINLNGAPSVDYREQEEGIAREGRFAVQIHAGGPMRVEFKDMYIQPLATPVADDAATPGFHLRKLRTVDEGRKYTVFLPSGYDPSKAYPVVLFLHGAGERGDDGITPAQVGLGAIIAGRPEDFPVIAVFPQARRTWAADSDDARAALAALEEVTKAHKTDPDRVYLTGLSMGGAGSWQLAKAHPETFAAVAPVCGFDNPATAATIKDLPIWAIVGDADSERIVGSTRGMVAALKEAGGTPRASEYRGVGHNSWDRAYSEPGFLEWLLAQKRKGR